jgi:hypothetical protein
MKRSLHLCLAVVGMALTAPLFSADQSPPCYRQLQVDFFREDLLTSSLSLYVINQSMWIPIYQDLQIAAQYVPGLVQAYAREKNPNPLEPYFNPAVAAEILQKALFQVFQGVMQKYAATTFNNNIEQNTINGMFRYIWEQQFSRLSACMR